MYSIEKFGKLLDLLEKVNIILILKIDRERGNICLKIKLKIIRKY